MDNYKATFEQWYMLEQYAKSNCAIDTCILELRARVEALEAQANHFVDVPKMVPPPVATDNVGQPIRKYLGMGQFERMSDKQIGFAKHW